jgi:hypothetical protein
MRRTVLASVLSLALLLPISSRALASDLPGDVNGDCMVNIMDLSTVANRYLTARGSLLYSPQYDLNSDGVINIIDIQIVAGHFDTRC